MRLFIILICSVSLFMIACNGEGTSGQPSTTSTQKGDDAETKEMVDLLKEIASNPDPNLMWHQNETLARFYEQQLQQASQPGQKIQLTFQTALQWLNAGNFDRSIEYLESLTKPLEQKQFRLPENVVKQLKDLLAIAYLRKGEIENCVNYHNRYSCILPLDPSAEHKMRTGSEKAMAIYEDILTNYPDDLQSKWLYNLAHMTLGTYPDGVPAQHLLPEKVFASDYEMPEFVDQGMGAGVAVNDISGGCIIDDFNNDGLLDIVATSYGLSDQMHYFVNEGNGKFSDQTEAAGLTGIVSGLNTIQADYNNDGYVDILILRGAWLGESGDHPNSLLRNNGNDTFSDVTKSSGIFSLHPTQSASWGDFNNDGWVDLFIGNESSQKKKHPGELFVNNGDGTFTEAAAKHGIVFDAFVKGCMWGDYNNDGNIDLFISNLTGRNFLFENQGKEKDYQFVDKTKEAGVILPQFSFPCWFWDYNNDGYQDLFVSTFDIRDFTTASGKVASDYLGNTVDTEYPVLYKNNGDGTFSNVSEKANLKTVLYTMGCNFDDIDNDGYDDFYAANGTPDFRAVFPNRMFRNNQGKAFQDVTTATKTGHIQKGHGVGLGDLDNDGDQDMYVVLGGSYAGDNFMNALFENPGNNNNWIQLKLEGTQSNKSAIGARIQVTGTDGSGNTLIFHKTVNSGASFGASSLRVEMGLGQMTTLEEIKITWPVEDSETILKGLEMNTLYKVVEGNENAEVMKVKSFKLGAGAHHHDHHHMQ